MTSNPTTSIAGIEVGLPESVDAVDAAWMTSVLRTSGAIDASTSVASITTTPFAEGAGLLSLLYRSELTYDGADGPASVIVKFPTSDPMQRGTADLLRFYTRELEFYRSFAEDAPFGSATCHAAIEAAEGTDFVLVMEDLSHLTEADQRVGCTWDQAEVSVQKMAEFHAPHYGSPRIEEYIDLFLPIKSEFYLAALPAVFEAGWSNAKTFGAEHLSPEMVAFGDRFGSLIGWFQDELDAPRTIVHGDWRADNLMFDGDELHVIDFQIVSIASGLYDVGYFASQSIPSEVRAGRDAELVDLYLDTLAAAGVDYDRALAHRQYKVALANCFIYAVTSYQAYEALPERSRELMQTLLQRSAQSILDNDVLDLVPAP